jgi:hypothetical protein
MGVINPGIWAIRLTGKDAQPLQSVKTVITAVLTVTSGPENLYNNLLLMMLLFMVNYDSYYYYYDDDIMLINDSI